MGAHGRSVATYGAPRVQFDVESRNRWPGAANRDDIRNQVWISVPELPWPLRFDFVRIEEDDGTQRWGMFGFEVGVPVPRDSSHDPADLEWTKERESILWENLDRYRRIAEDLIIPAPWNVEEAQKKRQAMRRPSYGALTDDYLALLAAEYRAHGSRRGAIQEMAASRGISRFQIRNQLLKAVERGLLEPERLRRRQAGRE
jgi:hypothetical protein